MGCLLILIIIAVIIIIIVIIKGIVYIVFTLAVLIFWIAVGWGGLLLSLYVCKYLYYIMAYLTFEPRHHLEAYLVFDPTHFQSMNSLKSSIEKLNFRIQDVKDKTEKLRLPLTHVQALKAEQERLKTRLHEKALAWADCLANETDAIQKEKDELSKKVETDDLSKLEEQRNKKDAELNNLRKKLYQLKDEFGVDPDPPDKRRERMYPLLKRFDAAIRFVLEAPAKVARTVRERVTEQKS
jgi:hypothetical protein